MGIPAITFSSPGIYATAEILDPRPNLIGIMHQIVNVVPDTDPVPQVDIQVGTLLNIRCAQQDPMSCHNLQTTMCELLASCGDGGGREIPRNYELSCSMCAEGGPRCRRDNRESCGQTCDTHEDLVRQCGKVQQKSCFEQDPYQVPEGIGFGD